MLRAIRYFAIAVFVIGAASVTYAAGTPADKSPIEKKWAAAEKNYIRNLSSENEGVRVSSAQFLGRYQLKGSTNALITMLKTDKSEQARKAAAFALIIMNEAEGVNAVEESSLYDGSDKVAAFCTQLLAFQNVRSYIAVTE